MPDVSAESKVRASGPRDRIRRQSPRPVLVIASCLCLAMLCAAGSARAANVYVGLGVGDAAPTVDQGSVEFHTQDWSPDLTAWRLFGGYVFGGGLGVEAGYVHLGNARVATEYEDFFAAKVTGFEVTPVVSLHVVAGLHALARAGVVFWNSDVGYHFTSLGDGTNSDTGSSLVWSLGAQYELVGPLGVRAEYTRYAIDRTEAGAGDFDVIMLSAVIGF